MTWWCDIVMMWCVTCRLEGQSDCLQRRWMWTLSQCLCPKRPASTCTGSYSEINKSYNRSTTWIAVHTEPMSVSHEASFHLYWFLTVKVKIHISTHEWSIELNTELMSMSQESSFNANTRFNCTSTVSMVTSVKLQRLSTYPVHLFLYETSGETSQ